ncbi:zinc finger domain-containing protein [Ophiocordyceps sinensis CO18]|uniref:Zinc finger domain-containing protein n=1 Tax=Ophiocordyceps sinensis (strain Co18 / CGMCC 3.14243) TaxID=911162 RepID=T5ABC2_OPHSC|nr:zinc finger domain-containing protein [Ophiocordyceps sinensis CO18]
MPVPFPTTLAPRPRRSASTLPRSVVCPLHSAHSLLTPCSLPAHSLLTPCSLSAHSLLTLLSSQGNCKFGPKCANVHVLPDGRRINYGKNGVTIGTSLLNLASRSSPGSASPTSASATAYSHGASASALTSSLYQYPSAYSPDDRQLAQHHALDSAIPAIDMPYSHSTYNSPRDDDAARLGFGRSPVNGKGLSVLDAPLPSSFDSNGISNAARFPSAPWPSSVPSRFNLDSPTLSPSSARESPRTSETLKLLHTSAFGSSEHLATPTASSPPNSQPVNGDEYFGKRTMHSSRYAKPKMLSASLPKTASVDRDWEAGFAFGDEGDNVPENYVPENLQDLLTPAEKARRGSMRADNDAGVDGMTKYGSPLGSSPSRWGPLFQRQKEEEDATRAARNAGSVFGHVGRGRRSRPRHTLSKPCSRLMMRPSTASLSRPPPALYILKATRPRRRGTKGGAARSSDACLMATAGRATARLAVATRRMAVRNMAAGGRESACRLGSDVSWWVAAFGG